MSPSIQLLKDRYLKNIKKNPDLYIGIELEFPIVHTKGQPTDIEVSKDLLHFLGDFPYSDNPSASDSVDKPQVDCHFDSSLGESPNPG